MTRALLIAFASLLVVQANAQSYSLSSAQQYAITNNAATKNAQLDKEIAKKKVWETTAIGLPRISGDASFQNFIDIPTQVAPANAFDPSAPPGLLVPLRFGTDYSLSAGLSVSQLIFDGSYIVGLQTAKIYQQLSDHGAAKTETEIKGMIESSYFTVLIAEESARLLEESSKTMTALVEEMKKMNAAGLVSQTDVEQLAISSNDVENRKVNAQKQVELARMLLKFQMGLDVSSKIELTDKLDAAIQLDAIKPMVDEDFKSESHIDFKLAQTQSELLEKALKRDKFVRLPSLGAFLNHSQNSFNNDLAFDTWYPTTVWGLSLKLPIFDSFGQTAKIKQSSLEVEKSKNDLASLSSSLKLQATQAQIEVSSSLRQFELQQTNMKFAKRILDETMKKRKLGSASSMEVSQMTNQYLTAQASYFGAMMELINAQVSLKKALNKY